METLMRPVGRRLATTALSIFTGACLAGVVGSGAVWTPLPPDWRLSASPSAARRSAGEPRAHLEGAVLVQARLTGANLRGAALAGACLAGAHLVDAHLGQADLTGADLTSACLVGADLRGANLAAASLRDAKLDGAALAGARYDERTEWPAGFDPARHGVRRSD